MEDAKIIEKIGQALNNFDAQDSWLSEHDLSERSIAHRIAYHLTPLFDDYHVDCEYNGDVDRQNNRKVIQILQPELQALNLIRLNETPNEDDLISRSVYPDIIIHNRGNNHHNLCAIEIKKSSNNLSHDYDKLKLRSYTTDFYGNGLVYQLGVFIEAIVGDERAIFNPAYFKNGREIDKPIT